MDHETSEEEKEELDRILMNYPHMFPYEVVVLWRTEIRDLAPSETIVEGPARALKRRFRFGIPPKFKDKIIEEYDKRVEEYFKITGRGKTRERLPKWARV